MGKRVVLATFGSLGDLHPFIAVAQALKQRGIQPVLATSGIYRQKAEAEGACSSGEGRLAAGLGYPLF